MFVNFPALSKVFKFADVEETGYVDVATISTLAVQLLGAQLSESEKETINSKAESKAEKGTGTGLLIACQLIRLCSSRYGYLYKHRYRWINVL